MNMKWSLNIFSVVSLFAVMFFSSTAWAHEGRGYYQAETETEPGITALSRVIASLKAEALFNSGW